MIEKRILRNLVLQAVSREPQTQFTRIHQSVEELVKRHALFPNKDECERQHVDYHFYAQQELHPDDKITINEIIWDLLVERIVTGGYDAPNPNLPFLRLTEFGRDYISKSAPHYYDPEDYMECLRNVVKNLDPVIEQYIFESLNCYRQQLFFASAVMIGAASEKAILLLLQAIVNSMGNPTSKKKAAQLLERPNLPDIFGVLSNTINSLIKAKTIPYAVHQGCTEHLMSLLEMIRVERNDAIHPITGKVNRDKVFLSLQTIPTALESINKLTEWFQNNSIP